MQAAAWQAAMAAAMLPDAGWLIRPQPAGHPSAPNRTARPLTVCRIMRVRPGCTASMESATSCGPCVHTNSARKTSSDLRAVGGGARAAGDGGKKLGSTFPCCRRNVWCAAPTGSAQPHRVNLAVRDDCRRLNSRPQMVGMYCGRQKGQRHSKKGPQDTVGTVLRKQTQLSPGEGACTVPARPSQ